MALTGRPSYARSTNMNLQSAVEINLHGILINLHGTLISLHGILIDLHGILNV